MDLGYTEAAHLFLGIIAVPTILWRPHLIIYLLIITAMLPFSNFIKFSIGGINIYLKDMLFICYFLCLISVIFSAIIHKVRTINLASPNKVLLYCVFSFVTLHIFYMLYGIFQGVPLDSAIRRFGTYSGCLYFFLPLLYIKTKEQLRKLLIFTVIVSLLYPAWQLFAFVGCADIFVTSSGTIRLAGAAAAPILTSALLAILIWRRGINQHILSTLPIVSILLIGHRSAYIATALSVLLLFHWLRDLGKLVIFSYLTILCIPLMLISLNIIGGYDFAGDVFTRLSDTLSMTDKNTLARAYAIRDNIMVFLSKPIFGIGYDHEGLSHVLTNKVPFGGHSLAPHFNVLHPHNFLMRFLSHTGLVGTSLILMIIISILRKNYALISHGGSFRSQGIFLFCSIMFIIVYSLMNTVFFSNAGSLFWILGGITVLLYEEMLRPGEFINDIVEKK